MLILLKVILELPYILDQPVQSFEELRIFMRDLIEATIYLHDNRIFYRDFKRSNLRWNGKHLVVLDFDCAVFLKGSIVGNVGTDGYKAPGLISRLGNFL